MIIPPRSKTATVQLLGEKLDRRQKLKLHKLKPFQKKKRLHNFAVEVYKNSHRGKRQTLKLTTSAPCDT